MSNVGDLFVSVRARTDGLRKGLRKSGAMLKRFSRSTTALVGGLAAGYLGLKGVMAVASLGFQSIIFHSKEAREGWGKLNNAIRNALERFAVTVGPKIGEVLTDWADSIDRLGPALDAFGENIEKHMKSLQYYLNRARNPLGANVQGIIDQTSRDIGDGPDVIGKVPGQNFEWNYTRGRIVPRAVPVMIQGGGPA